MHNNIDAAARFWSMHSDIFLGVAGALLLGIVGSVVLRLGLRLICNVWTRRGQMVRVRITKAVATPLLTVIWTVAIYFVLLSVALPLHLDGIAQDLPIGLQIIILVMLAWIGLRVTREVEEAYPEHMRVKRGREPDPMIVDAVGKIMRILIVIVVAMMILRALNFSIASLLAFGGVAGIAIGFAAQGVVANLFGALVVYLDQPFKVGEWIVLPAQDIFGTVEHIGWRATTLRGFDTRPYYVPNQIFNTSVVQTPPRMQARRINETVSIRYADFPKLPAIVEDARQFIANNPEIDHAQSEMVYFTRYGDHALQIMVYCFAKTQVWAESLAIQERVLIELGRIVRRHGAELAVPISQIEFTGPPAGEAIRGQALVDEASA